MSDLNLFTVLVSVLIFLFI